jgi:hypothetical protein
MRARVNLYAMGTNHGPGGLITCIEDASEIGLSSYANAPGEMFFTLPYDHYAQSLLLPLQTHVQVQRQENEGSAWSTIGWGLVSDYDALPNSTVWYVDDYLALFDGSLTALDANYKGVAIHSILQSEALMAIRQSGTTSISADSRLGFIAMGNVDTTATSTSITTSYQGRLSFMRQLCQIQQAGTSTRPIMTVGWTAETPPFGFTFNFYTNRGQNRPEINLEYGGLVSNFRTRGGFGNMATQIMSIGQKQDGAAILYSTATYLAPATYGIIQKPTFHTLLPSQAALDALAATDARQSGQANRDLSVTLLSGALAPFAGYVIGDAVPITILRGNVALDHAYYTIWGLVWRGHDGGSEDTQLLILPRDEGISGALGSGGATQTPVATASTPVSYKVQKGDSLSKIGNALGVDWRKIASANGITAPWTIKVDQVLVIPNG